MNSLAVTKCYADLKLSSDIMSSLGLNDNVALN